MKSPKAAIKNELLVWARETAGFSRDLAAKRLQVKPDRLASWEDGEDFPTIKQLRRIADLYKRPVSVFYLSEIPIGFQVMRDLRRLPEMGLREYSPGLVHEMRTAQQRRELALELLDDIDEEPVQFDLMASLDDDPEVLGQRVRKALGVTYSEQIKWREGRVAFNAWRERIENLGVLVFQITRVETSEVSGFALSSDLLPLVAVNRRDTYSRRVFSLLHEFVHLMLCVSGASDLDADAARPPEDARVESFCNQVAAAGLMPRERFLAESAVQSAATSAIEWPDKTIEELSKHYSVSREAIVRRLLNFNRTTDRFYRKKRAQYAAEYQERKAAEREKYKDKEFRKSPARDTVLENGRPFVRLVLQNYYQNRITLSDVSAYLGVRVKHLPRIEMSVGTG